MRILVVAATAMEVAPLFRGLGAAASRDSRITCVARGSRDIDILTTGVGMVAASAWTSKALGERRYDVALNVGICGSFDQAIGPTSVLNVVVDRISELGAEDGDSFLQLDALLDDGPAGPKAGCVHARLVDNAALRALPSVNGITVNTVHGSERSIADIVSRFSPQVESMEGAGFMFACAIHDLHFAQVRSVSNMVERRNRSAWKVREAIDALTPVVINILDTL
jgi:futalosine hydrolase